VSGACARMGAVGEGDAGTRGEAVRRVVRGRCDVGAGEIEREDLMTERDIQTALLLSQNDPELARLIRESENCVDPDRKKSLDYQIRQRVVKLSTTTS
jgi:hypothetical protein